MSGWGGPRLTNSRVLLKISGETLASNGGKGFTTEAKEQIAKAICSVSDQRELGVVIGGGNIFRGSREGKGLNVDEIAADYAGMVATIANGIILRDALQKRGVENRLMSALEINKVAEPYIRDRALRHLEKGRVIILVGGTGNPRFTTDTNMVLRATELRASMVLKGTKVEGIFSDDPSKNKSARFIRRISHNEFLQKELGILDATAVSLARDNGIAIRVFNIFEQENLRKIVTGRAGANIGSLIAST